jgi:hypothetical protein
MKFMGVLVQFYVYELEMQGIDEDRGWWVIKHGVDPYPRSHEDQGETS